MIRTNREMVPIFLPDVAGRCNCFFFFFLGGLNLGAKKAGARGGGVFKAKGSLQGALPSLPQQSEEFVCLTVPFVFQGSLEINRGQAWPSLVQGRT